MARLPANPRPVISEPSRPHPPPPAPPYSQSRPPSPPQAGDSRDETAIVRTALNEWHKRRFPGAVLPQHHLAANEKLVASCAAAVDGDAEAKLQALRDSIAGAFLYARRAPGPEFIWGRLDYSSATSNGGARSDSRTPGDRPVRRRATVRGPTKDPSPSRR
jgi:hypothetical protein